MQIVLTKKKDLRLLQFSHNIMPFCGGSTDTKGESLEGQNFSDLLDVSSGCPLSFNPTTTKNEEISTLYRCL
jgi:hypothetical protein